MARAFPAARALALVAAAGLALSACGDDETPAVSDSAPTASATANAGNGILKIGTLLPETGSLSYLGPPEIAGVKLAIQEINDAGGVLGQDVEVEYRDSGDTTTDVASQSVNALLGGGADAIVGAAASGVSLLVIDRITGSGVLQISPANTSTDLTTYPDDGLYFRTAPSDIYQGRVVAETAQDDGAETLGILARQDSYGTSLANQAEESFTEAGGEVVTKTIYNPEADEFSAEVSALVEADPDAIALIGFEPDTVKIIDEMTQQGILPLSESGKEMYFVDGNMSNSLDVADGILEGIKGTTPGSEASDEFEAKLREIDPNLSDLTYAGEAYDAVTLVALAAEAAESDAGVDIAAEMQDVSSGGEKCDSFATCMELLDGGQDIDFDGFSGPVEFDDNGNPSVAAMGVYQFGADNQKAPLQFVTGAVAGGGETSTEEAGADDDASASPSPGATSGSASASEDEASPSPTP